MDSVTSTNVTEDDYKLLTISVLRPNTKEFLNNVLKIRRVLPSPLPDKLPRDFRGLCTLLNYNTPLGFDDPDPIGKIFKFCELTTTIEKFIQFLERMDRYDIIDDSKELITSDIDYHKKYQFSVAIPNPSIITNYNYNASTIITLDDFEASKNGLPPPRYDAFLLFDDADIEIARSVVDKLEKENLKLCIKERDILPGAQFDTKLIPKIIAERCNWLLAIVSNDFLKSTLNRFVVDYTQWFTVDKQVPKIIPCVFGECTLPEELKCYVHLNFYKKNQFCNPWDKLKKTLSQDCIALTNREIIRESYHVEKDLEEQNTVKIIKISDSITENLETNKIQKDSMPVEQPKKKKNIITKIFKTVRNISKPSYDEDKKKKREILMS